MNTKLICTLTVLIASFFAFAQTALAQSCDNVSSPVQGTLSQSSTSASANNCGHNTNFTAICSNSDSLLSGGMDIYSFQLGASYNNVVFSLQSAAFTPELAVIGAPCSSGTACIIDNTIAATGTVTGTLPSGLAAGTYYVFVANVADAACGAYNLSFTGTLPVKLQKFSVN